MESKATELREPFKAILKVAHTLQVSKISWGYRACHFWWLSHKIWQRMQPEFKSLVALCTLIASKRNFHPNGKPLVRNPWWELLLHLWTTAAASANGRSHSHPEPSRGVFSTDIHSDVQHPQSCWPKRLLLCFVPPFSQLCLLLSGLRSLSAHWAGHPFPAAVCTPSVAEAHPFKQKGKKRCFSNY